MEVVGEAADWLVLARAPVRRTDMLLDWGLPPVRLVRLLRNSEGKAAVFPPPMKPFPRPRLPRMYLFGWMRMTGLTGPGFYSKRRRGKFCSLSLWRQCVTCLSSPGGQLVSKERIARPLMTRMRVWGQKERESGGIAGARMPDPDATMILRRIR